MRHTIESVNWTSALVEAIQRATSGDTIVVQNWYAAQLGYAAADRLKGEDHGLLFEVDGAIVAPSAADAP